MPSSSTTRDLVIGIETNSHMRTGSMFGAISLGKMVCIGPAPGNLRDFQSFGVGGTLSFFLNKSLSRNGLSHKLRRGLGLNSWKSWFVSMLRSKNELDKLWPCSNCGKLIKGTYADLLLHAQQDIEKGILSPAIKKNQDEEKKIQEAEERKRQMSLKAKEKLKKRKEKRAKEKTYKKGDPVQKHPFYKSLLIENQKLRQILKVRGIDINKAMRSTKYDAFYQSTRWRDIRYNALVKNRSENSGVNRCSNCGVSGKGIMFQVDHIKPRYSHPSLEYDPKNLQVLCADCNIGKGSKVS